MATPDFKIMIKFETGQGMFSATRYPERGWYSIGRIKINESGQAVDAEKGTITRKAIKIIFGSDVTYVDEKENIVSLGQVRGICRVW